MKEMPAKRLWLNIGISTRNDSPISELTPGTDPSGQSVIWSPDCTWPMSPACSRDPSYKSTTRKTCLTPGDISDSSWPQLDRRREVSAGSRRTTTGICVHTKCKQDWHNFFPVLHMASSWNLAWSIWEKGELPSTIWGKHSCESDKEGIKMIKEIRQIFWEGKCC
jgi:hypothetical protein